MINIEARHQISCGMSCFASLNLLDLNKLGEVTKYSSSSSLLVVKLISIERRDLAFLFLVFAVFSGFKNCHLSTLISSKIKAKRLLSGNSFSFKASLLLLFEFSNGSIIGYVVVVSVTIVSPLVEMASLTYLH